MKYIIQNNGCAAYLQLYRQVREDITNGVYSYHDKLPSKRTVADELGISTITVEHAYALLEDEGYIESKERSGYYVIFRTSDMFATFESSIRTQTLLTNEENQSSVDFPLSVLTKKMRKVISDYGEAILCRPPSRGCEVLREEIRRYLLRSRGIVADTDQIIIGSGAEYLYGFITMLLGRDRRYAIESPSYQKIELVYRSAGVLCDLLPLGEDGIDSAALAVTEADVLHITPYRSFPSGVTASASKRHEYLRWASERGRYLVEDDFESEFSVSKKSEETLFSDTKQDNVIYLNSFSKTISPGLRVGYMVLPRHLSDIFESRLGFLSCTVPTFEQYVIAELLSCGDFERHINCVRRKKRREAELQRSIK